MTTMTLLAVAVAVASAGAFAVSAALQHRVAGTTPASCTRPWTVLRHVATKPVWLSAMAVSTVGLTLHAVALNLAPIAVVQPVLMSGVVLAVFLRAALARRRPSGRELRAVALVAAGLAAVVVLAQPSHGVAPAGTAGPGLWLTGTGLVIAGVIGRWGQRLSLPVARGLVLGAASGVLFGMAAALLKAVSGVVATAGVIGAVASWSLWVWLAAGICGTAINQRAYQVAPLSASMPMINVVGSLVALALGIAMFGEIPAHDPLALLGQGAGLAAVGYGLHRIAVTLQTPDLAAVSGDNAYPAGVGSVRTAA
jgi:hypothetical protein